MRDLNRAIVRNREARARVLFQIVAQPQFIWLQVAAFLGNIKLVDDLFSHEQLGADMPNFLLAPTLQPTCSHLEFQGQSLNKTVTGLD